MYLHHGDGIVGAQGIEKSVGIMGESPGIYDYAVGTVAVGLLYPVYEISFMIALIALCLKVTTF